MYLYLTTSIFAATFAFMSGTTAFAASQLLMAEEPGCVYCARWNAEIGPIYPKTGEGAAAPLLQIDITEPLPDGITLARPITYTPTFVLLVDGTEQSRLEGYPGEDFFWGIVGDMLKKADIDFSVKPAPTATH